MYVVLTAFVLLVAGSAATTTAAQAGMAALSAGAMGTASSA